MWQMLLSVCPLELSILFNHCLLIYTLRLSSRTNLLYKRGGIQPVVGEKGCQSCVHRRRNCSHRGEFVFYFCRDSGLTPWGLNKIDTFQITFPYAFCWKKYCIWLKFPWSLQGSIWNGIGLYNGFVLHKLWPSSLMPYGITQPQWVQDWLD